MNRILSLFLLFMIASVTARHQAAFLLRRTRTNASSGITSTCARKSYVHVHVHRQPLLPVKIQRPQSQSQLTAACSALSTVSLSSVARIRGGAAGRHGQTSRSSSTKATVALLMVAVSAAVNVNNGDHGSSDRTTSMSPSEEEESPALFNEDCLDYDHYKGVTVNLDRLHMLDESLDFSEVLQQQLQRWKSQGKHGVWIRVPKDRSALVATCIEQGFDFHTVAHNEESNQKVLVLTQWLPDDSQSRLPAGPSHQVGVGCLVWHPADNTNAGPKRRMLVVQEKSGPAAAYGIWKMPTGLSDAAEDIHDAAVRELYEETGLTAAFDRLLLFRQAHSTPRKNISRISSSSNDDDNENVTNNTNKTSIKSATRTASDLFFVCQMSLRKTGKEEQDEDDDENYWNEQFTACPQEIAAIQWMPVDQYCNQPRWGQSPVYKELNRVILQAASQSTWEHVTLPLREGDATHTNTLYKSESS